MQAIYKPIRNTANTRHTESLNYFYFTDEASRHTHTQTQKKRKRGLPFRAGPGRPARSGLIVAKMAPNFGCRAHTVVEPLSPNTPRTTPRKVRRATGFHKPSPLFPQHSSRSAASLSASPTTDTDSRRGTSALDPLPLHTLLTLLVPSLTTLCRSSEAPPPSLVKNSRTTLCGSFSSSKTLAQPCAVPSPLQKLSHNPVRFLLLSKRALPRLHPSLGGDRVHTVSFVVIWMAW